MFIIKWWRYIRGYLVVSLQGRGVERLLNLAIVRGIGFWDLHKKHGGAVLCISLSSFRALRPFVRQTRCRLQILRKVGLPFWMYRLRRRWGLAVGALIFVVSIYLATSMVWFIRVTGTKHLEQSVVIESAESLGLKPGVWKATLNLEELEEELARIHGDIAWVGIRIQGVLLEIEIVEHSPEPEIDERPADIVAAKDGLIERVLVLDGEAVVAPGDTVSRGDILIEGMRLYSNGILTGDNDQLPPEEVRARGKVEARVWYESRVPVEQRRQAARETGSSKNSYYIHLRGKMHRIWGPAESPFDLSRRQATIRQWKWRNFYLPVEIITVTYHEMVMEEITVSVTEALKLARQEAMERLTAQLPEGVEPVSLSIQEYTDQGQDWVRAMAETREDIAEVRVRRP